MTIAVQQRDTHSQVYAACSQQQRLLRRLESVSHYLGGVVAGMWLPGIDSTFDSPVRRIGGRRPVFLTLEVCDNGSLNFTGAISRFRSDKFLFSPIFAYDVSAPFTRRGGGRVLPANNLILARRANDLLAALISYGRDMSFGVHAAITPPAFPKVICDAAGTLFEDYSPVLGLALPNPARDVARVPVSRPNPAAKILAQHGLDSVTGCDSSQLSQIVNEFRAQFADFEIDGKDVMTALNAPDSGFCFSVPFDVALAHAPQETVNAMRLALSPRYRADAGYTDLMLAAKNPSDRLYISRLSAIQIFTVDDAQDLPEEYGGTVLAPVNWVPPEPKIAPVDNA
jgi:hypothetical protein